MYRVGNNKKLKKTDFHTRDIMLPKIIRNLGTSLKNFGQLSPRPKILKNLGLKGQHIVSLPGAINY